MNREFFVSWEIELGAPSPLGAAKLAQQIQRDPLSMSTVFKVTNEYGETVTIDLSEIAQQEGTSK